MRYTTAIQLRLRTLAGWLLPGVLLFWLAAAAQAEHRLVGYLASYTDMSATLARTDLSRLTHINIAFANPDADGLFVRNGTMTCMRDAQGQAMTTSEFATLVGQIQAEGVKVLISVAGGVIPNCSGDWAELLKPAQRQQVIDQLLAFVDDFQLDGLDIDIEGELLTRIDQAGHYTPFIERLSGQLQARGKLLTCATASYVGGMIPVSAIPFFDFVNIMAYDAIGPSWGPAGAEHSPYAMAQAHLALWQTRGLPKEKTVLGVPFYGYGFGSYNSDYAFHQLVAEFGPAVAQQDLIGSACRGCSYITYNGIPTLKAKARLALEQGSGVMVWELAQQTSGELNLLAAIHDEILSYFSSSSSSSGMSPQSDRSHHER